MAREHGRSIREVASDSYALTLWTYLQSDEADSLAEFVREYERIDGADMITRGFIRGTPPIAQRFLELRQKATGPVMPETVAELSRRADDLWRQHERAMKQRPVS